MKQYRNLFIFLLFGIATVEVSCYLLSLYKILLIISLDHCSLLFSRDTDHSFLLELKNSEFSYFVKNFATPRTRKVSISTSSYSEFHWASEPLSFFQCWPLTSFPFIVVPVLRCRNFLQFFLMMLWIFLRKCEIRSPSRFCSKWNILLGVSSDPPQHTKTLRQSGSRGTFETTQRDGWQSKYRNLMVNLWTFSKFRFNNMVFSDDRKVRFWNSGAHSWL